MYLAALATPRCLDAESKGQLSVVKPIDEETLMGTQPKAAKQEGSGRETAKRHSSDQAEENASEKSKKLERKKSEPMEKSESTQTMLDFLKGCGWGT